VEPQEGRSKRVDGCILQTERPGPSVGEFVTAGIFDIKQVGDVTRAEADL